MKTIQKLLTIGTIPFLTCTANAASIAINLDVPDGRGDGDAGVPTITDFLSENPNGALDASTPVVNLLGAGNGSAWALLNGLTSNGFTFATTGGQNGFNAGDLSHNDLNPITEGYVFGVAGQTITISGLAALSNAGDQIVLGISGIGDNIGQDSQFTADYAGLTAAQGNTQESFYNTSGNRLSTAGTVSFVNFTYLADGTTDTATITIDNSGQVNALTVSIIPVPEPSSTTLLGLGGLALILRRRK